MKKMLVFLAMAMVAGAAMAQLAGIGNSYVYHVEADDWYAASGGEPDWIPAPPNFDGHDFGIVNALTLGGQVQTWAPVVGVTVTEYVSLDGGVTADTMSLTWIRGDGGEFNNNDVWENLTGVDVAAALAPGDYTVDVYFSATDGATTVWDSNGGNNYAADFTKAIPEPATMSLLGLGALAMVLRRKMSK